MPNESSPQQVAFGRAVRQLRLELGLSQEQLGFDTGLHRNYIGGVERGELNASLASVYRLAGGLGVKPSELLELAETIGQKARKRSR